MDRQLRAVWRDAVMGQIPDDGSRVLVASDPDRLLLDGDVLAGLADQGTDLLTYADPMAFRLEYETKYRGNPDARRLLVRTDERSVNTVPYDVLQTGRAFDLGLTRLLPGLSYPVASQVSGTDRAVLYTAVLEQRPAPMGDDATKEFILRHVFGLSPELVTTPAQLLALLIRLHYQDRQIPSSVAQRLAAILSQRAALAGWPVSDLVERREAFLAFVQERWDWLIATIQGSPPPPLQYGGPADLPFDNADVRVYLDNLFLEGHLRPVASADDLARSTPWLRFGVAHDVESDHQRRVGALLDRCLSDLPEQDATHHDWLVFARKWAELRATWSDPAFAAPSTAEVPRLTELEERLDATSLAWLTRRYGGLYSHPPSPPVMVHHVPHAMALELGSAGRVALVVVDGMAYDQWLVLRAELRKSELPGELTEQAAFAWIPTLTSVSRQAIFAGRPPLFFGSSIQTTAKEPQLWRQFWTERGVPARGVGYLKGLGEMHQLEQVADLAADPNMRALGLVVDKLDSMMHGEVLGHRGLHGHVREWASSGFLGAMLDSLLSRGFTVVLTADHGNVEARGVGRPKQEGVLADVRGQRARIYPDETLRELARAQFEAACAWAPIGLPNAWLPLLAGGRTAFTTAGERIVSHGGAALEEVVVPVVWVRPRDDRA